MKKYRLLLAFLLITQIAVSQSPFSLKPNLSNFMPSPNASALGIYGSVDVSPFTGIPNIGIDVFSLKQGDIEINARLSYFAGGVKPEAHPSWIGQNWTLNVGGVVTRKQNGAVDEMYATNYINPNQFSYFHNNTAMSAGDWFSDTFIKNVKPNNSDNASTFDLSPDEFFFTLPNGVSGSFFLGDDNKWKVKSRQAGNLKIAVDTNSAPFTLKNYNDPRWLIRITRLIYKINITDQDGVQYVFGNTPDAIEFIRGPRGAGNLVNHEDVVANSWYLTKITSPKGEVVNFVYQRRENQYVQSVSYNKVFNLKFTDNFVANTTFARSYSSQMITPSYLTEINSNSFRVQFTINPTTELKYVYNSSAFNLYTYDDINYSAINDNIIKDGVALLQQSPPKWYKLEGINIYDRNNKTQQSYSFIFNDNPNERLFLKKFRRIGLAPDHGFVDHEFEYNAMALPGYNSLKIDQWGYYNGKTFPENTAGMNKDQVMSYLDADSTYIQAGMLKKIIYPTGGYTNFEYEPNQYSQYLEKTPTAINLINGAGIGGGLRIRKIIDNDANASQYTKQYHYTSSLSPGVSSGILAGIKQIYINTNLASPTLASAEFISNNSFSDLDYTDGRDVVYSEVKEVLADGSYNLFKYSNSDNIAYRDEVPKNLYSDAYFIDNVINHSSSIKTPSGNFPVLAHISRELERGQLLSKKTYSATNKLVYEQNNQYRDDALRFEEYIRSWSISGSQITAPGALVRERYFQAIKTYIYFPYLKSSTETTWDNNGLNPVSNTRSFIYDTENRLLTQEIRINSKAEELKTTYRYPFNMLGATDPNGIYQKMVAINQISPVIETAVYRKNNQIRFGRVNYFSPYTGIYLPQTIETQTSSAVLPELRTTYTYDNMGNVENASNEHGPKTSYKWDIKGQYPVLVANNALANNVFYDSFEDGTGNSTSGDSKTGLYSYNGIYTKSVTGLSSGTYILSYWKKSGTSWSWVVNKDISVTGSTYQINIPSGQIDDLRFYPIDAQLTTYTYEPLVGMTSMTDVKGEVTYYQYDGLKRLKNIKDKDGNLIKQMDYNFHQ